MKKCVLAGGGCSTLCESRWTDCRGCIDGKRKGLVNDHQCPKQVKQRDGASGSVSKYGLVRVSAQVAHGIRNAEWVEREPEWCASSSARLGHVPSHCPACV